MIYIQMKYQQNSATNTKSRKTTTDGYEDDSYTGFVINNALYNSNLSPTPFEDSQTYKSSKLSKQSKRSKSPKRKKKKDKSDKKRHNKKRQRNRTITEDPSDDDGNITNNKISKTYQKSQHIKSKSHVDRKRKASTPTPNAKDRRKHKREKKGGSDKLHRNMRDPNPFPRSTDLQNKMNVSPIDQQLPKSKLKKKDKNKLSPPNNYSTKKSRKTHKQQSHSEPWHQQQFQHQFGKPRRRRLEMKPKHSNTSQSVRTNMTTNTRHTATNTTNSETPIPEDINPLTMDLSPINVGLVTKPINGKVNGQQGSPGKTTTISSAYVPPPPSPQLVKKRNAAIPTNMTTTLSPTSPPFHTIPDNERRISNNTTTTITDNTATYDDGNNHLNHSRGSLSPSQCESNNTPTRDLSGSKSPSNTKTITFRAKYGTPDSTVITKSPPQPSLDALHSGRAMQVQNDPIDGRMDTTHHTHTRAHTHTHTSDIQQRYRIRVEGANNNGYNSNSSHSTQSEVDGDSTESSQSSDSESEYDGINTSETKKLMDRTKSKAQKHLAFERKHYIVGSMDSDGKTMFGIPPVPYNISANARNHSNHHEYNKQRLSNANEIGYNQSTETNYTSSDHIDEYKDVPLQNPYGHRQLRPLPDTGSIGTISPDWRHKPHYNHDYTLNKLNRLKFKNHRSSNGSSGDLSNQLDNNNSNDTLDDAYTQSTETTNNTMNDMATISTVTKTPSPEDSHADEEKAYAPSQPANNPYLLEPKKNSNSHSGNSNHNQQQTNLPSLHLQTESNHYDEDFNEKEYIFAQHLEDTIKTLTKSDQASENDDEFIEQDSFMKIDDDKIWLKQDIANNAYVE